MPDAEERRPPNEGATPKSTATTTSHSLQLAAEIPPASSQLSKHEAGSRYRASPNTVKLE